MKKYYFRPAAALLLLFFFSFTHSRANIFYVTSTSDSGPGTLRQCILDANNTAGKDSIYFNIAGPDFTIDIDSGLTKVLDDIVIDATTQPGFTNDPIVIINGNGWNGYGLVIGGASLQDITVKGLEFSNFWKTDALTSGRYRSIIELSATVLTFEKNTFKNIGTSTINYGGMVVNLTSSFGGHIADNSLGRSQTAFNPSDTVYTHIGFYIQAQGSIIENNQVGYFHGDSVNAFQSDPSSAMFILSSSNFASAGNPMFIRNNTIGLNGTMSVNKAYGLTYFIANIIYDDNFAAFHLQYHHITDNIIQGCELGGFLGDHLYNLVFFGPNNHVWNNPREGVVISSCNYMNVIGNLIENNNVGVKITLVPYIGVSNLCRKVRIGDNAAGSGNKIYNNKTSIIIENANSDNFILNNDIKNNTNPVADVIINGSIQNTLFEGNTLNGNGTLGMLISNSCQNNTFNLNTIAGYTNGLEVYSSCNTSQFNNNTIIGINSPNAVGIKQYAGGTDNVYYNNSVSNFPTGVELSAGAYHNRFYKNAISNSVNSFNMYNGANTNKVSQTSLISSGLAINLNIGSGTVGPGNNSKTSSSVTGHSILGNVLTLTGTGTTGDSVEAFVSIAAGETALNYAGHALVDGAGNWSIAIAKGAAWSPTADYYYITTATDASGNTSQLSAPHLVPQSLPCSCLVTSKFDVGPGSLRDAIDCSNNTPGKDTIQFAIPGSGIQLIQPLTALPAINDTIFIDGFSQSGQGIYDVVLDGTFYGGNGLQFWDFVSTTLPHASKVEGLSLQKFNSGIFVSNAPLNDIVINKCKTQNGSRGIAIIGTVNCTLSYNEITNNSSFGIYVGGAVSSNIIHNTVANNLNDGIYLTSTPLKNNIEYNSIFGNSQNGVEVGSNGRLNYVRRNNIYSNSKHGVLFSGTADSCYVEGNLIGADSSFSDKGNLNYGINISFPSNKNTFVNNNTIGFNKTGGIYIQGTDSVKVTGNYIGTNASNANLGNTGSGIYIYYGSSKVNIGDGTAAGQNVIAYNSDNGILVASSGTVSNSFSRNLIFNNGIEQINLDVAGPTSWGNNSKVTPYIIKKTYFSGQVTLSVRAEAGDIKVEVFKGGPALDDAVQFISGNPVNQGAGNFSFTFPWPNSTDFFTVTSTNAAGSSSEIGYELARSLVVTNTNDNGVGSLRVAINASNIFTDTSTITFAIPGSGPHIIQPPTDLPKILYSTFVNGSTDPDEIIIDGSNTPFASGALYIGDLTSTVPTYKSSHIHDITFKNSVNGIFIDGHGTVKITNSRFEKNSTSAIGNRTLNDSLLIDSCYIFKCGTTIGAPTGYNTQKVFVENSTIDSCSTGISFMLSGKDAIIRNNTITNSLNEGIFSTNSLQQIQILNNHISGNKGDGISLSRTGNGSQKLIIKGNTIGLLKNKTTAMPNKRGFYIDFSSAVVLDSNYISGNLNEGIYLSRITAFVSRNYIGTNKSWIDLHNGKEGISDGGISGGTIVIGGSTIDSANYIGFNQGYGITTFRGDIKNNYIGVSPAFTNMGNLKSGVRSTGSSGNYISNYIGFNKEHGIEPYVGNIITGNYIGGDSIHDFGNEQWGINDFYNCYVSSNTIANNDSGGVSIINVNGKLSKNLFLGTQPKAIWLNNGTGNANKQPATISSFTQTSDLLTIDGTGVDTDTVEVFYSAITPETAKRYLGYVVPAGSAWQLNIPKGPGYDPLKDNYYLNTATTTAGNTSQLSAPFVIPVNLCSIPNLNTLPVKVGICKGDSVLVDSKAGNVLYRWYDQNNNIVASTKQAWLKKGGDYHLEVEDSFGCISLDTLTAIENTLPLTADFLMTSEAGKGDKVIVVDISFTAPDSLVWDFGNATVTKEANQYELTFADTGNFQVTVTSYLGLCSKSATHYIHIDTVSRAIPDGKVYPYVIKEASLRPNPNNGLFKVDVELANPETVTIYIYNAIGMLKQTINTGSTAFNQSLEFDLSDLASGNYFVRILSGKDSRLLRMEKE